VSACVPCGLQVHPCICCYGLKCTLGGGREGGGEGGEGLIHMVEFM
jgi:hypothetical protein